MTLVILPLLGGILIGLSASMLWLTHGQVAGVSGMLAGILRRHDNVNGVFGGNDYLWPFLVGLLVAGAGLRLVYPQAFAISQQPTQHWLVVAVAGVLVGYGTRLGGGCTSGHGVCGVSRLSARSLAATAIFMAAGIVTVYVKKHLMGYT